MSLKVYIIGKISDAVSITTQKRFYDAQKQLEKFNIQVYNPVNAFLKNGESMEQAIKNNLNSLLNSNAVYVLNDSNTENNVELMTAMKLNILIMHEC